MAKHYVAVDLGASSGRVIVGRLEGGKRSLMEMSRFKLRFREIGGS